MPDREVPDGWRKGRLGDLVLLNPDAWEPSADGTIRYLDIASITAPGKIGPLVEMPSATAPSRARRKARSGDVLVSTVRPYLKAFARVSDAPDDLVISTGFAVLRPLEAADGEFIYQQVLTEDFQRHIGPRMTGTGYPAVRPKDVPDLPILLPPPEERTRIAEILDAIDTAIEKTEAVIEATEGLRSALLHELLTRGVPGWHTEWKDVPGIGTIPACWEVVQLGDVLADGPDNGLYKPESEYGSGVWIIRITDFSPGRLERTSFDRVSATPEEERAYAVGEGNILINRVNSLSHLGKSVLLPRLAEPTIFESNMMKIRVGERVLAEYAIKVLCSPATRRYFLARAKKAVAQASINQTDVRQLVMPLPTREEQGALVAAVAKLDERTTVEVETLTALRATKAAVAAALLSGRVRVLDKNVA